MTKKSGFTLMEIVLVMCVIALIIGGIVASRSLIRTSQLQSIASEQQQYAQAIVNFKEKYHALPGDFAGATAIWGAATCSNSIGTPSGTETCNGNGDGYTQVGSPYEHIAAWRHLGLSGFITGNYSGNSVSGGSCAMDIRAGDNVPRAKLKGAGWHIGANTYVFGGEYIGGDSVTFFPMDAAADPLQMHALWLGGSFQDDSAATASCGFSQIPVLAATEALEVDTKFDDGNGLTGKIRMQYNNLAVYDDCNGNSDNGHYKVTSTATNCSLAFIIEP